MRKDLIVLTFAVGLLSTAPLLAAELNLAPEAALCPVSPTAGALAMASCRNCTAAFSPQLGVVCTWDGTCTGHGANECCNYTCACDNTPGLPGTPPNACQFSVPNCCSPPDCCDCSPIQFSPQFGVVCTLTGTCQQDGCCESTCTCGVSDGLPGTPANACALTLPCGCCLTAGGCRGLCTIGYCNGPGERCVPIGCGFGCCIFGCGHADPTCTGIDPIPPEACP